MGTESLLVLYQSNTVGELRRKERDTFTFTYSTDWLSSDGSFAVSLRLPLTNAESSPEAAHTFFSNLLPEGRLRYLVCRKLGISRDNDFELLKAIGGECAGALTIVPEELREKAYATNSYRLLSPGELRTFEKQGLVYPAVANRSSMRLSLAGAQDKLPVVYREKCLYLPLERSPSSHILKFSNRDFKHLPANEVFTSLIAREIGIPAVDVKLIKLGTTHYCLVSRYDRQRDRQGNLVRMHQEDFCQALGHSSTRKYEQEGGPSFAQCASLIERYSGNPIDDIDALLRWQVFNTLLGNADGHAKNLSIVHDARHRIRPAPFYDLVCTACYPGLDRRLAMSVGGCNDPGQIGKRNRQLCADRLGIQFGYLQSVVTEMAESLPTAAHRVAGRFTAQYGSSPIIGIIQKVIARRCRRSLRLKV